MNTETTEVETSNELVTVITKSGVEKETAKTLLENFTPFFEKAKEWKEKADKLIVTDATQVTEMKQARAARLALKDLRVEADKVRKTLKEDSLRYGKAVQGVYNVIEYLIVPIEQHLEQQEKFAEIAEKKRKVALADERTERLKAFDVQTDFYDLANMAEADFTALLENSKAGYEKRIEDARKAEAERIETERLNILEGKRKLEIAPYMQFTEGAPDLRGMSDEAFSTLISNCQQAKIQYDAEQARIKADNERLEKELAEQKAKAEAQRKAAEAEAKRIAEENAKKAAEEKARVDAEQERMRKEAQAKLDAERKERERVEAELKAKAEAEAKAKAEEEARKEAELAKGDADKIEDLKKDLEALKTKYSFKSAKNKKIAAEVSVLLDKAVNHIISKQ